MFLKSRVYIFVSVMYFMTSGTVGTEHDGFERSNYYTNDQGSHVGDIQNQPKSSAKRQEKKVEHVHNNRAKYHEPKKYNTNAGDRAEDDANLAQPVNTNRIEGRNNLEKRSQHRTGLSGNAQQHNSHYHIPSGRVRYCDGDMQSHGSNAQRLVRKSFNEQGNSNWRWGFRRKQSKGDHSLKETGGYLGGNPNSYKIKDTISSHNAREAMEGNSRLNDEDLARQSVVQSEPKYFSGKNNAGENYPSPYGARPMMEDRRAIGQPQWASKEAEYQLDNAQRAESKGASRWMNEGPRNYFAQKSDSKDTRFSHPNLNQVSQSEPNMRPDYRVDYNEPNVETKVLNKPIENMGQGLLQIQKNEIPPQMGEVRNYDTRNFGRMQNLPKGDEPRNDQSLKVRYENPQQANANHADRVQTDISRFEVQDPGRKIESPHGMAYQNQNWDDRNALSKLPSGKHAPENVHVPPASIQRLAQPDRRSREEIRYLVLSPAEFSPETLRRTLGEPEKPRGIPYCTLEEYKMESAELKAKSYDSLCEKDMRYNGKGSINELISRLKRNNPTPRGPRIKSRASGEGPEMPVHACTASPSTRQHSIGMVVQTQAIDLAPETTTLCWVESLTNPTVSAEDIGINFRITPSYKNDDLRGRLPIISQFDYTAGTQCSTPGTKQPKTCQCRQRCYEHPNIKRQNNKSTSDQTKGRPDKNNINIKRHAESTSRPSRERHYKNPKNIKRHFRLTPGQTKERHYNNNSTNIKRHIKSTSQPTKERHYKNSTNIERQVESTSGQAKERHYKNSNNIKRHIHFPRFKSKRTLDEVLLTDIIRHLESSTKTSDPVKILPNVVEEERIIEKYLTDLMENQANRSKTQKQNPSIRPGWLEKLLKELAENKSKTKMHMHRLARDHSKLSLILRK